MGVGRLHTDTRFYGLADLSVRSRGVLRQLAATEFLSRDNVTPSKPLWSKGKTTCVRLIEGSPKNKSVAGQEIQD